MLSGLLAIGLRLHNVHRHRHQAYYHNLYFLLLFVLLLSIVNFLFLTLPIRLKMYEKSQNVEKT